MLAEWTAGKLEQGSCFLPVLAVAQAGLHGTCWCLAGRPASAAVWLVAPFHWSVGGAQAGREWTGRWVPPLKGCCQSTAPCTGKGLRRTSAIKKECPTKSKWCACSTGLLAPVGSTCHSPQPSAWDATSSSPSQSLYHCCVLPFVTKAAIVTGTLFQALGDVCSPPATHLLILL